MKKNVVILFIICCALQIFAQPSNTNLSNTQLFGGEPYLAINPANPQNIVVAWMAVDLSTSFRVSIKSKSSFDGGNTWNTSFVQPHFGPTRHSADVSMQFRNDGVLFLSYVDYQQNPDSGGVYVTQSSDGGINWSSPVQVWNANTEDPSKQPLDRPWLVVDNSTTSNSGMMYMTTKPAPWILPPNRAYFKSSSDSGLTWSPYRFVDTTGYLIGNLIAAPMAAPAVTADGAICVAYPSYVVSQSIYPKMLFGKSYNRGASFQYNDLLVSPASVTDTLYKLGYHLCTNPSTANQLCFLGIQEPGTDPDVYVYTSNDGGLTWTTGTRVNDDPVNNGVAQDMPWAGYDLNNKLVVTWRDRRNSSGTGFYQSSDTYCAVSDDNGLTFHPNILLSDVTAPFDSILEDNGNDFLSCELHNDTIYAAWGDVRSGNLNIYFTKVSDSTGTGSGIVSLNDDDLLRVYPNPVSDKVYLDYHNVLSKAVDIRLYNQSGQLVLSKELSVDNLKNGIDVSGLAKGVYYLRLRDGEREFVKAINRE
jgi:hypothetical protein